MSKKDTGRKGGVQKGGKKNACYESVFHESGGKKRKKRTRLGFKKRKRKTVGAKGANGGKRRLRRDRETRGRAL